MSESSVQTGNGVTNSEENYTFHNPKFSTSRGERRHAKRSAQDKERAEKTWGTMPKKTFHNSSECRHKSCKTGKS